MSRTFQLAEIWKKELSNKNFLIRACITLFFLAISLFILATFLPYNETRPGYLLKDPFLSLFQPVDVTWFTFVLIYGGLIIAFISLSFHPEAFLLAL